MLCPGSSLEKSPPRKRGVHEGLRFGLEAIVGGWDYGWSETPVDARWSETPLDARLRGHDKQLGLAPAQAGGGQDGGALHHMVQGGAGMTTIEDRALRLVVTVRLRSR